MSFSTTPSRRVAEATADGFTLIELLTVVAILGVLAAILVPSIASAHVAAKRSETKVRFAGWVAAMEGYRQAYGAYPVVDDGSGRLDPERFAAALTGRALNGGELSDASQLAGNLHRTRFYTIDERELNGAHTALVDAFGNEDIAVLVDRDGDGRISTADGPLPGVLGRESQQTLQPSSTDLDLAGGLRAGVIFYSAGRGQTDTDLVFSWK
ncbi:MAG: prepilin-type N-terminal cleavage/methylation domain-containing protein [Verrucomicrobia bacterium]|nr:prepilin-type N-terminal cleavage/methylation domain-containing protein [Verrucomicrobiota bacterium]